MGHVGILPPLLLSLPLFGRGKGQWREKERGEEGREADTNTPRTLNTAEHTLGLVSTIHMCTYIELLVYSITEEQLSTTIISTGHTCTYMYV